MSLDLTPVIVDRPLGSRHPKHPDIIYELNYGYVPGIIGGDGEEQDAYIIGINEPIMEFAGKLIAVIKRRDDVEDKWVVAPTDLYFTEDEIRRAVDFQEKFFDSEIIML